MYYLNMFKKTLLLLLAFSSFVSATELKKISISEQTIELKEEKLVISENDDFYCEDYVQKLSEGVSVICLYDENFSSSGDHSVGVIGLSDKGDSTIKNIEVQRLSVEEYQKYIKEKEEEEKKRIKQESLKRSQETLENIASTCEISEDPVATAQCFVGLEGWCTTIAQKFIDAYFGSGLSIYDTYDISYEEAKPGDIIYYTNGGLGMQHYAVYLGNDIALQGNMSGGISKIGSIYLNYGSEPQFRRINGL